MPATWPWSSYWDGADDSVPSALVHGILGGLACGVVGGIMAKSRWRYILWICLLR